MKKQLDTIKDEEVKLSIWDMFVKKLFETEGLNQADINSEFLIKNLESLNDKSAKLGYERTLKILQDQTRVFDYYQVYEEFINFKKKLKDKTLKHEQERLIMMIEVEILKNMDKAQYHRQAISIMLQKEEYEMAEEYCANYEGKEEEEEVQDEIKTDNYFGM
jgi:high-affinity Fe2+/Pb2+ permease